MQIDDTAGVAYSKYHIFPQPLDMNEYSTFTVVLIILRGMGGEVKS